MSELYEKYLKLKSYVDSKNIYIDCSPNYYNKTEFEEYLENYINNSNIIKYINKEIFSKKYYGNDKELEFDTL